MRYYTVCYSDGTSIAGELSTKHLEASSRGSEVREYEIKDDSLDYRKISYIDLEMNDEEIKSGDDGFYILNTTHGDDNGYLNKEWALGHFKDRADGEYLNKGGNMSLYALKSKGKTVAAIVTGMRENAAQFIKVENNSYFFFIRFFIEESIPYENIKVLEYTLPGADATYSDIAAEYRDYQLSHGFAFIKDRINEDLSYAAESLNVRIRMAWKPVPCTIFEQTPENEPDVHVACNFDDVAAIIEAYHCAGIKKAEFCLVGWNMKGHDGRWPQILPVEESIGGIDGLKKVIALAEKYGYKMTCHTNSTDAYSISELFNENDIAVKRNGEKSIQAEHWSGGRTYNVCPKRAYEISMQTLPEVAALGFKGMHYIDVITCTPPRECFSKEHPVNKKQSGEYFDRLFADTKKLFGAVGCEGPFEYSLKNCDSTLYVSFADYRKQTDMHPLAEKYIPMWQLVYHGIVLSNPYARTVNPFRSETKEDFLKVVEYGGRPQVYYYAHFVDDGTDWIGEGDYTTESIEKIKSGAEEIRQLEKEYEKLFYLQYEFMVRHEETEENVFEVEYSDGTIVTCDYNSLTYKIEKRGELEA